ncbi:MULTISPECIES: hypothetical protein [Spiroplasma]|uniref:hypothetical protein n=1 Tax=Spiroplasma TaxID=2132 RepID=UPI0018DC950D|nr:MULTISPECIES: hypothetical protein [Spiroplasma]MBH8623031.1 hypothetical protein [Spiroplasma sp. hyd1]UNF62510.1 hypothetical protein MNU24_03375 [Spiroplasma poulsonii]
MKNFLSLVSGLIIGVTPVLTLNVMSLYVGKDNFEVTDFKPELKSNEQAKKIIKRESSTNQQFPAFIREDFELETPITKVTAFYTTNSDENTFVWKKELPIGTKYKFFNIEVKPNSNYWAEGGDFNYFSNSLNLPLFFKTNISLVNNTQNNKKIAEIKYNYTKYETSFDIIDFYTLETVKLGLTVNLEYFNNVMTTNFIAKATVQNTNLFSWVKTQAKFYFRVIIYENKL